MLLNPDAVQPAITILSGDADGLFLSDAHRRTYNAILNIVVQNKPVDVIVLMETLQATGELELCGGPIYISELTDSIPTSANVEHYAGLVLDAAIRRRLIANCAQITEYAYEGEDDISTLLGKAEAGIFNVSQHKHRVSISPISELTGEAVARIEDIDNPNRAVGLSTGLADIDRYVCGLKPSDMIVLAARPSVGKTALALNIASHAAVDQGKGVLMFSLEMSKEQLTQRMLCREGRIDVRKLRDGFMGKQERDKLRPAAQRLSSSKFFIDDTPNITMLELMSKARRHAVRHATDLIIIDYLQLMGSVKRGENRQVEISEISRGVKALARELQVPVLALSQLSREAEREDGASPKLSHLRESGSIEQDADLVWMLWRKDGKAQENDLIKLNIAKHRNGQTGVVDLMFLKNIQRFECMSHGGDSRDEEQPTEQEPWFDK
jgi:replicative DNA helicase